MTYESVSRFVTQGGAVYFGLMFVAVLVYALWPKNREGFERAARLPLDDEEG